MVEDVQLPDIDGNISDLSPSEKIAQLDATLASAECEKTKWSYRYGQQIIMLKVEISRSPGGQQFRQEIIQFHQDENKTIQHNSSEYKELKNSYQEAQTPDEKRDILQKIYVNFRELETAIKRQVEKSYKNS